MKQTTFVLFLMGLSFFLGRTHWCVVSEAKPESPPSEAKASHKTSQASSSASPEVIFY